MATFQGTLSAGKRLVLADFSTWSHRFCAAEVAAFAEVSGDKNPLHLDEAFAATTPFGRCIVHGMLVSSMFSTLFATQLPGTIYLGQDLKFKAPVHVGDAVTARIEVIEFSRRRVTCSSTVFNDTTGKLAVDGEAVIMPPKANLPQVVE